MTIELLLSLAATVGVLIAGAWALIKIVVRQYERSLDLRFAAQEAARVEARTNHKDRFDELEKLIRDLEREFMGHMIQLPREYVRREDHIRFETVIQAKLDSLASKIDLVAERQTRT